MHRALAAYKAPDDANELVRRYGAMIDRCARRIANRAGNPSLADDLWSAGALGLIDAASRFDPRQAVRFETFAEHRIRGAMLDEMRKLDHLPRRLRAQAEAVSKARRKLVAELGREPTSEDLARALGIELDELAEVELAGMPHVSLLSAERTVADEHSPHQEIERRHQVGALSKALATLPERLQLVLSLHYVEGLTYREIAEILEVSEPRVCQLHADALRKAREQMAGQE